MAMEFNLKPFSRLILIRISISNFDRRFRPFLKNKIKNEYFSDNARFLGYKVNIRFPGRTNTIFSNLWYQSGFKKTTWNFVISFFFFPIEKSSALSTNQKSELVFSTTFDHVISISQNHKSRISVICYFLIKRNNSQKSE